MAHAGNLHIQTQALGTILLVTADGRIDGSTILQLRTSIAHYGQLPRAFILNLQNVSYISSSGLKFLLELEKRAEAHGGAAVVVIGANDSIKAVLLISGFDEIIRTYDDNAAAIASLGGTTEVRTVEEIWGSPLSRKQEIVLRTLRDNNWLNAGIYGVILLATRFAVDPENLLELVIGIGHLERIGVPVVETILMIAETGAGERLNCQWSARRWQQEHIRLSRKLGTNLPAADRPFDVGWIEKVLRPLEDPLRQHTKILDTPRRVTEEGYIMRHCIGNKSYMNFFRKGSLACLSILDAGRKKWTITVRPASVENAKPSVVGIRGRFNVIPDSITRQNLADLLGPGLSPFGGTEK